MYQAYVFLQTSSRHAPAAQACQLCLSGGGERGSAAKEAHDWTCCMCAGAALLAQREASVLNPPLNFVEAAGIAFPGVTSATMLISAH